jgi:hypothetical protein
VIVEPAWAAVDIAISRSKNQIVRRGFLNIIVVLFVFSTDQEIDLCWVGHNSAYPTILAKAPVYLAVNNSTGEKRALAAKA